MHSCRKITLLALLAAFLVAPQPLAAADYQPQNSFHQDHRSGLKLEFVPPAAFKSGLRGEALAREFLSVRAGHYQLPADLQALRLARVQESLLATHYHFQQTIHDIDVEGAEIIVSVSKQSGDVARVYNNTYPVKALPPVVVGKLGPERAYDIAWNDLRVTGRLLAEPAARLVYVPEGTDFRLSYIVDLNVQAPSGAWESRIDALSGEVLQVRDTAITRLKREPVDPRAITPDGPVLDRRAELQRFRSEQAAQAARKATARKANGTGQVFDPDPRTTLQNEGLQDNSPASAFTGAYFTRDLLDISENAGVYSLTGPWVSIINWDSPNTLPSTTANGVWNFTRGNNGFNDALTYFHLDQNQRYMQSLGFLGATGIQQTSIGADTDGFSGADNSAYYPGTNRLTFGHGCVDDSEDADVVLHEYGHAITYSINSNWFGGDTGGMGEGFGDYWAGSYSYSTPNGATFRPEWMFSWDGHGTGNQCWPGRVLNAFAAQYNHSTTYGAHQGIGGGFQSDELWSTPLFQALVTLTGMGETREEVDTIVLESMFGLGSGIKMRDVANSIVATANSLYPGQPHATVFTQKFQVHNILLANPADIDVTPPGAFNVAVGGADCDDLIISNVGEASLNWIVAEDDPSAKAAGGPDAFGYTWIDSDEPGGPAYSFDELSGVGTLLSLGDDDFADVSLPFAFPFYGADRTSVRIDSNGYLNFASAGSEYTNATIPSGSSPDAVVAPFWDDLNPLLGGSIQYAALGVGPAARFVVQYSGIQPYGGGPAHTFQVVLEPDGSIEFRYQTLGSTTSATVGIESPSGSVGLQVAFNQGYLHDNLAIRFELLDPCPWLSVSPQSGTTLGSGGSTAVQVCVDATGLAPGTYNCNLLVNSDDPDEPSVAVPVSLTVGSSAPATAIVTMPAAGAASVYSVPDGSGKALNEALAWDGTPGNAPVVVDATMTVRLEDGGGSPVSGYPAASITMGSSEGSLTHCSGSGAADGDTNPSGEATFSGPLLSGGHSEAGELAVVEVGGAPGITMSYAPPSGASGLDLRFNSADITGDLIVDLADIGLFSTDLEQAYDYRSDFFWDGIVDLADISIFASSIGAICPAGKQPDLAAAPAPGNLGIFFDAAATRRSVKLDPGEEVTAYLMLTGDVAAEGIIAWEATVRTSSNVEVREWSLPETSLNLGEAPEFMVGTGGSRQVKAGDALLLATLRLVVSDASPASIYVEASPLRSGGQAGPVIAQAVQSRNNARLRPLASSSEPVATINDGSGPWASLPTTYLYNVPNPFNPSTEIRFSIPQSGRVDLQLYDVSGRLVRRVAVGDLTAGPHAVTWDGRDDKGAAVGSGLYFARMILDGRAEGEPIKMSLVK